MTGSAKNNLQFRYAENHAVPIFAALPNGAAYTGRAYGSIDAADWMGEFINGLPHGEFRIVWGDRVTGSVWFENGTPVKSPT
jgi:hypothetical protein